MIDLHTLLAGVADVHLGLHTVLAGPTVAGINDRARMVADLLRRAVDSAMEQRAAALVIAGDLFDVDVPSPQMMALAVEALSDAGLPILIVPGNHDQHTMLRGDHALGALAAAPMVRVVDEPTVVRLPGADLALIPFRLEHASDYIPAEMARLAAACRVDVPRAVAVHAGISDARTPPFLSGSHEAIPAAVLLTAMEASGYALALAGNWHDHRSWERGGRWVVQCGALCPTGFDNPGGAGLYGSLVLAPIGGSPRRRELHGPRFFRVTSESELQAALADPSAVQRYIHVHHVTADSAAGWRQRLETLRTEGLIHAYRVRPSLPGTARMDAAARTAQAATTRDEALSAYVAGLPLPPGVTGEEVLQTVHGLLGQAGVPPQEPSP